MGADERLLIPQRSMPIELQVPERLEPDPGETLVSYGKRVADRIDPSRPFYLAGISLGGMIALEAARHTSPRGLILISSCRSPRQLSWLQRFAGKCAPLVPLPIIHAGRMFPSAMRKFFGAVTDDQAKLFDEMMRDTPPAFIRWAIDAVVRWPGVDDPGIPTLHIHGGADRIIPCDPTCTDHIIPGAGHLMNMTHANEVNVRIIRFIESIEIPG